MDDQSDRTFLFVVPEGGKEERLDLLLCSRSTGLSRSRIQTLIRDGNVKVNTLPSKPSHKVKPGDEVRIVIPGIIPQALEPEEIEFQVLYEDPSIIVLNKPPGLVVHPAPGHNRGTLVHGLLHHCEDLSGIGGVSRPGIVHRLDKDTSGLMVVAKNDKAHLSLSGQFKRGEVKKTYIALVHGRIEGRKGEIDLPIGRHPKKRKEMSIAVTGGRRALTLWRKIDELESGFSLLEVFIKTGRTHQIRVHFSHLGHPVVGDPVYGYGSRWWKKLAGTANGAPVTVRRQMLHSQRLGFIHPVKGSYLEFEAPIPDDMHFAMTALRGLNPVSKENKGLDINKKDNILKKGLD